MHKNLEKARYLSLATFRRNGAQVNTAVWFAENDDRYYLFSASNAGKVKRVRNSTRARVAPCDVRGALTGDWLEASCDFANEAEEKLAYKLLLEKYSWQMRITNLFSWLSGKIRHRTVLVLTITNPEQP